MIFVSTSGDKDVYEFGEEIVISTEIDGSPDEGITIEYYIDNRPAFTDHTFPFEYRLSNIFYRSGPLDVLVIAYRDGVVVGEISTRLTITADSTPTYSIHVIREYNHDDTAFTQGLIFSNGVFYESTGLYGASTLRKVIPETGEVVQSIRAADEYFCEGITLWNDKIVQLTWRSGKGFVYETETFNLIGEFSYAPHEGWGLTHDDHALLMSDGTSTLYYLDPSSKEVMGTLSVSDNGGAISRLNELEYIHDDIFANIWQSDRIARISKHNGHVIGWIDCSELSDMQPKGVLNGIAYDEGNQRLFLTGKNWSKLYEVEIIPEQKRETSMTATQK